MDSDSEAGRDGQQAWDRLLEWYRNFSSLRGLGVDGDSALAALADVGRVRRLVDQAEFEAVRTARAQGKSWAEIAVRLGVTRQSAWERWRDVDDAAGTRLEVPLPPDLPEPEYEHPTGYERTGFRGILRGRATASEQQPPEAASERRRRSTVRVPDVVGLARDEARKVLDAKDLRAISADPDGPPLDIAGLPGSVVTDQSPESGARVPPGSPVRLWLGDGGPGPGVREPRRPSPDPKTARQMRDEASDEAVS
ncbi:MAG TPA: PASTA domain-containing protein [Actinocrinis sp.]|nr:PASTA domain-containing protein [Actinocrinis sp.]